MKVKLVSELLLCLSRFPSCHYPNLQFQPNSCFGSQLHYFKEQKPINFDRYYRHSVGFWESIKEMRIFASDLHRSLTYQHLRSYL